MQATKSQSNAARDEVQDPREITREKLALEAIAVASKACGAAVNATMARLGERSKYTRADAALSLARQLIGLAGDSVKGMDRFTPKAISELLDRHINS